MGGMGRERIHNMKHDFKFISKHSPQVKSAYSDLMEILSLVHDDLRKQYTFQHKPVGSYSRNMITYDAKSNIGFDFDINIYPNDEENRFTAKQIKLLFKQSLDKFAHRYGYDFAEDSTRVLTIKVKDRKNSRILHSVDFAFVNDYEDDDGYDCQEYIHYSLSVMVVVRLSLSRHPRQVVRSPCGSASTRSTFLPSRARPTPKLTVVVVLPVPPF